MFLTEFTSPYILGPSSLLFSGCRGSFPGLKQPELELNTLLHLASRLRRSTAITLLPLYAFKAWTESAQLFFFFSYLPLTNQNAISTICSTLILGVINPNFLCPAIWPSHCRVPSCRQLRVTPSPCSLFTLRSPFCKESRSRLWEFPFSSVCVCASSFQHGSCRLASYRGAWRNVSSVGCNPLWAVANHTPIHASILHNGACSCTLLGTSLLYIYIYIYIYMGDCTHAKWIMGQNLTYI